MDMILGRAEAFGVVAVAEAEAEGAAVVRADGMIANTNEIEVEPYWFSLSSLDLRLPGSFRPGRRDRRERGLGKVPPGGDVTR